MTLSTIIELALGLIVFFYILSMIVQSITGKIAEWLDYRAKDLEEVLRDMLTASASSEDGDANELSGKFKALVENPLIQNLVPRAPAGSVKHFIARRTGVEVKLPGKIPSGTFSLALLNTFVPEAGQESNFDKVREAVEGLPEGETRTSLLALIDSSNQSVQEARTKIENWFDDGMQRVSSLYRMHTRRITFIVGLIVVLMVDADAITVSQRLWDEPELRAAVSAEAQALADSGETATSISDNFATLDALDFPIFGIWQSGNLTDPDYWGAHLIGWLITWAALSLGASFWYDMLKRLKGG